MGSKFEQRFREFLREADGIRDEEDGDEDEDNQGEDLDALLEVNAAAAALGQANHFGFERP